MFPKDFDSRIVSVTTVAAVLGISTVTVRAALACEDYVPDANGMIQFGVARQCVDRYFPHAPRGFDDSAERASAAALRGMNS